MNKLDYVNRYPEDPLERLRRKFGQESELMCLALNDNDKADAERHRLKMEEYRTKLNEYYQYVSK